MGYPTGTKKDEEDILREAKERYDAGWQHDEENITEAYDDLRFGAGEQWPTMIAQERTSDGRPMLTSNMIPKFVKQITGDMRLNKPAIKVRPAGGGASKEVADIATGLIRNIEANSDAGTIYIKGGESAVRAGLGGWAIVTEYTDDDIFEQDIRIRQIPDPLNVIFDPDAREITREDAKWAFWVRKFSYEAFKAKWPDAKISSWDQARTLGMGNAWFTENEVMVAWYYVKKPTKKTLYQLANGEVVDGDDYEGTEKPVKTRVVETHKVCLYEITEAEILSGPTELAGKYIPLVPVIGEEIPLEDRVVRHGAIRFAKDPQRMYNYHQTTAVEAHALAPKAPFIGTTEQFKGLEKEWRQANRRNLPYLRYNSDPKAPGAPQRSSASTDISASMALAERAENDMYGTIGIYPPSLGQKSNEQSGKAIIARQREADVGSYVYIDNLSKAIAYTGRILVDMIPKIYDTARTIRTLNEDGTEEEVEINKPIPGELEKFDNDITIGRYDVVVETGPAYSTKRAEAAQAMTEFASLNPQGSQIVMDLIAKAQDWPDAERFEQRFKMALPPGIDPEVDIWRMQIQEQMKQMLPPQPPDPALVVEERKAEAMAMKEQNEARKLDLEERRVSLEEMQAQAEHMLAQAEQTRKNAETSIKATQVALERRSMEIGHRETAMQQETERMASMPPSVIPPELIGQLAQVAGALTVAAQKMGGPKRVLYRPDGTVAGVVPE